jgi:ABC-type Mn2+/Zn2+ transport system ATPase subunit
VTMEGSKGRGGPAAVAGGFEVARPSDASGGSGAEGAAGVPVRASALVIGYGTEPIVSGLEFSVEPGQALALVGTNGSGKTTLLRTLVGLLPVLAGRLDVFGLQPGRASRRMAYLGQFHAAGYVLPVRVVDVVRMGRFPDRGLFGRMTRADEELVREAMRRMGVEQLADEPLRSLSGGQQQRAYLAQVLARRADLLVLDEPTAGLDAGGRERFEEAMATELARGATMVIATHDIQDASECDLVLALARRVVAFGPPQAVLNPETLLETFGIAVRGHVHGVQAVGLEQPFDRAGQPRA